MSQCGNNNELPHHHVPCDRLLQKAYRELKQPQRQRKQNPHKFAYLTIKNSIFARFARAFVIFWHFEDVLVLSTTWNDPSCSCVDNVSVWWQMFNFVPLCPKRWFQFNSRIVRTHFSSIMSLNNWKMIAETRSHIFRWRSRLRVSLSSLMTGYFTPVVERTRTAAWCTNTRAKRVAVKYAKLSSSSLWFH